MKSLYVKGNGDNDWSLGMVCGMIMEMHEILSKYLIKVY
jgi:hypothetical protein